MTETLTSRIAASLDRPVRSEVQAFAKMLAKGSGASAILFYGSNLRTGSLEGVLDFYILLPGPQRERIWPRVSYREWDHDGVTLRAKIATMSMERFAAAASGASRDTAWRSCRQCRPRNPAKKSGCDPRPYWARRYFLDRNHKKYRRVCPSLEKY